MNTILVLTDFSQTSSYASLYACVLSKQLNNKSIVLYHSYQNVVATGENITLISDEQHLRQEVLKQLRLQREEILSHLPAGTIVRFSAGTTALDEINEVAGQEGAWLIVMGTTGKNKMHDIFLGSNALSVCKTSRLPVILVPAQVAMEPVKRIIFAVDSKNMDIGLPGALIKKVLEIFKVPVSLVSVTKETRSKDAENGEHVTKIKELLITYDPPYHTIVHKNAATAILEFASGYQSPLIMLLALEHSFPGGLLHKSVMRQLAGKSTVPILVLNEFG